jgi:hypothetical protein
MVEGRWSKGRRVREEADLDVGFARGRFGEVCCYRPFLLLRMTFRLFDLRLSTADFRIRLRTSISRLETER